MSNTGTLEEPLVLTPEESLHLLKLAEETAHMGHWQVDLMRQTVYWSDEVYRIHGVTKENYTPELESAMQFYHPDDRERVEAYVDNAISKGKDFQFSLRLVQPNGSIRRVSSKGICMIENGTVTKLFGIFTDVTDKCVIERRAEEASLQLQMFIDHSYDGFWDWYIQDDYEYMSPRFWEMLGYNPDDKRPHPSEWQMLIFPEDLEKATNNYIKHAEKGEDHPYSQEVRYRHADGSTVYISCRGQIISRDENGQPLRMIGTHTDITQQKLAQMRAEDLAERYDVCVRGSNAGMWDWNIRTGELFWSQRFKDMLGLTDQDFIPHFDSFASRIHQDDRESFARLIEAHCDEGVPFDMEYRLRKEDGDYIYVHAKGQSVRDPNTGHSLRMAGSVDDITENYMLKQKEQETQKLLQLVIDKTPDAICVKDDKFRIVQANSAFLALYPKDQRSQIIGSTTFDAHQAQQREMLLKHDYIALACGTSNTTDIVYDAHQSKRLLATQKIRFENSEGKPYILSVARDVTEEQLLLEKLNRSNSELNDFAYIASHDLKEPLRGIHNHAKFLLEDFCDEMQADMVRRIDRIIALSLHGEQLVTDLLYYSRLARIEEAVKLTEMQSLLENLLYVITPERPDADIVIENALPVIQCDPVRVSELFRNLITNALKYNHHDKKIVRIGVSESESVAGHPVFYVKDNGIGIDARYHDEIFRIFRQLHKKGKYGEGNGAGLTIVKKIIDNHGGDIWLESEPQHGTIFYFTLGGHICSA